MLHEALDRAALAGGVATFEDDDVAATGLLDPHLQLQQLDLQKTFRTFVFRARHPFVVRVRLAPGVHRDSVTGQQHGVVVVVVPHAERRGVREVHDPGQGEVIESGHARNLRAAGDGTVITG